MKKYFTLVLVCVCFQANAQEIPRKSIDSKTILPKIAEAIEDEIYDLQREGLYFQVDGNAGGDSSPAEISMYVSKEISPNGLGVVIYKNMPVGEVFRYFTFEPSGTVKLSGNPTSKFPSTGGSLLTIYMANEDVCDFIYHKAYKSKFIVDPQVKADRIKKAEERQKRKIGYSFRLKEGPGY